jgi:hypothetical protein
MTPDPENKSTLQDELNDLIKRKQAENQALRKLQDLLQGDSEFKKRRAAAAGTDQPEPDAGSDAENPDGEDNTNEPNQNNQ